MKEKKRLIFSAVVEKGDSFHLNQINSFPFFNSTRLRRIEIRARNALNLYFRPSDPAESIRIRIDNNTNTTG